jgi:hypothetical protein
MGLLLLPSFPSVDHSCNRNSIFAGKVIAPMNRPLSRRHFLTGTALTGSAMGLLVARPAGALSIQPMDAAAHRLFMDHCSVKTDPYHQALLAEAKAELPAGMDEKAIKAALAALNCPICGCPIATGA